MTREELIELRWKLHNWIRKNPENGELREQVRATTKIMNILDQQIAKMESTTDKVGSNKVNTKDDDLRTW